MYLGIDFGLKRVGLAVAPEGGPAAPLGVIEWGVGTAFADEAALVRKIIGIAREQGAETIVVGMPTTESQSRSAVERFVEHVRAHPPATVVTEDERLSTKLAERLKQYKGVAEPDAVAAMVILEGYLVKFRNSFAP